MRPVDDEGTGGDPALRTSGAGTVSMVVTGNRLGDMRRVVDRFAAAAGLSDSRRADLVLAASEATSNSLEHAHGPGLLRLWQEPGAVILEVTDAGHVTDPQAGQRPPAPRQSRGRGLWLINQVADHAQIRSHPGHTAVRITMRHTA